MRGRIDRVTCLNLTDRHFEHSTAVTALLDFITHDKVDLRNYSTARSVIALAQHWTCEAVLKAIKVQLRQLVDSDLPGNTLYRFQLAIQLKDYETAAEILRQQENDEATWETEIVEIETGMEDVQGDMEEKWRYDSLAPGLEGKVGGPVEDGSHFDLRTIPCSDFEQIPPTVVWAVLRAVALSRTGEKVKPDYGQ